MRSGRTLRLSIMGALLLAACGGSDGKTGGGDGDGSGDGDGANGDGGFLIGDAGGDGGDGDGDGNGGLVGNGMPEICDGIDNNADGDIDNLDAAGDGVCDCLNIATIGQIGGWSSGGNVFKEWLNTRGPAPAVEIGDQVLTDELLRPFQVIVVLHVSTTEENSTQHLLTAHHEFSQAEVAALERWVKNGGGLMTTIGYHNDEANEVTNVNRLLAPLGMAYSTSKLDTDGFIDDWEVHPVTADIKRISTHNGAEPDGPNGMTLARDGDGDVAMQVTQPEKGHVIVWGDEWITYDSEWQDVQEQQVDRLWLNMLKWMSPEKTCQVKLPPIVLL